MLLVLHLFLIFQHPASSVWQSFEKNVVLEVIRRLSLFPIATGQNHPLNFTEAPANFITHANRAVFAS